MGTLRVFFAYQFRAARISAIEREAIYTSALEDVRSNLQAAGSLSDVRWDYWNILSGAHLSKEIFDRMDAADIFVFDLSDDNANVFIEIGFALKAVRSEGKQLIVMLHDERPLAGIPSDLAGMFILQVNEGNLKQRITAELHTKARRILASGRAISPVVSFSGNVHIICPELPKETRPKFADHVDPNYLRYIKFADLDTLFYVRAVLSRLSEIRDLHEFTAEEHFPDGDVLQIVIGGPAWNRLAKQLQANLPLQFEDGGQGNDDPVVDVAAEPGRRYLPDLHAGILRADVSFVARISRGPRRKTLLLSGCRTCGVLGAAKSLMEPTVASANAEWIERHAGEADFAMAFMSDVISGQPVPEHFVNGDVLAFYRKVDRKFVRVHVHAPPT